MANGERKRVEVPGKGIGGIVCPKCGCADWRVRNTQQTVGAIRRYRVCRNCGHIKTTSEK